MWLQQPHRGQAQRPRGEQVDDHGEPAAGVSGLDTVAGGILGEPKRAGAIPEEGSVALGEIEVRPQLERGQVSDELGRGLALRAGQGRDASEEVPIRQGDCSVKDVVSHASCVTRSFFPAGDGPGVTHE